MPPRPCATPSARACTRSSPRATSTSRTSCSPRARTCWGRRARRSRTRARWSRTSSSARWTPPAPTSSSPPRWCAAAIEEGATTINIPDTVGYAMPQEYAAFLGRLYELVPGLRDVVLSVHCHDDLGLAVANSFAGLQAGARQVECAINGIGERAGNASLEEIVMLLAHARGGHRLHHRRSTRARSPAPAGSSSRLTGYAVQPNKAVVGRNAFQHESGIHRTACSRSARPTRSWPPSPSASTRRTRSCSASTRAATRCSRR